MKKEPFIVGRRSLGFIRGDGANMRLGEHPDIQTEALPSPQPQPGLFLSARNEQYVLISFLQP